MYLRQEQEQELRTEGYSSYGEGQLRRRGGSSRLGRRWRAGERITGNLRAPGWVDETSHGYPPV